MGWRGRYYFPACALLLIAAIQIVKKNGAAAMPRLSWQRATALLLALIVSTPLARPVWRLVAEHYAAQRRIYLPPQLTYANKNKFLRQADWLTNCLFVVSTLQVLPPGATAALSEVGMSGAMLPNLNLIDTAGLNDTQIIKHGFDNGSVYERKPDFIWLMNPEYTQLRGRSLTDPRLLADYDVYAEVFSYGVAIRRNSPYYAQLNKSLQQTFLLAYGSNYNLADYRVSRIEWDPKATRPGAPEDVEAF